MITPRPHTSKLEGVCKYRGCSFNLTSILTAGLIARKREGRETRLIAFFTPVDARSTEEEYCRDLSRPRKVDCKTRCKHSQNAVDWIHLRRAQQKGISFWQAKTHVIITNSTLPPDCVERAISHRSEMTIYQRSSIPRLAPRIVVKSAWHKQQQQQQDDLSSQKTAAGQCPRPFASTMLRKKESSFQVDLRVHGVSQDDIYKDERMTDVA